MQSCCLIYGHEPHHLDHLGVLASLLKIPLLVTEHDLAKLAEQFYPNLSVITIDYLSLPEYLITHFDLIFYTMPRSLFDEIFFLMQKLHNKKLHTVWCPHGNSDKGQTIFYMEALQKEERALVYGNRMIDFLKTKNVFSQLKSCTAIGNFRHAFYRAHKTFYDKLAHKHVLQKLPPCEKLLLYAPTWQDYENSSSFYEGTEILSAQLPSHWCLIIKLHPNLLKKDIFKTEQILSLCNAHARILVVSDFTPVYPLLNAVDFYIGDYSSIGYDFLTFNRPLFFFHPSTRPMIEGLSLFSCGPMLTHKNFKNLYQTMEACLQQKDPFEEMRKKLYLDTFGPDLSLKEIEERILSSLTSLPDPDLNFF